MGPLCGSCHPNYGRVDTNSCQKCTAKWNVIVYFVVYELFSFCVAYFAINANLTPDAEVLIFFIMV